MLPLKVWTFKITMINVLQALLKKVDYLRDQIGNLTEGQKLQNESIGNAKKKKHSNRNEEFFSCTHQVTGYDMINGRINKLKDISIETLVT